MLTSFRWFSFSILLTGAAVANPFLAWGQEAAPSAPAAQPEALSPEAETAQKLAQGLADATVGGDYAKVVDSTYPALVNVMGGRDKAIAVTTDAMEKMKGDGFIINKLTVGKPGQLFSEGENSFIVIPTSLEMTAPQVDLKSKSYLLAISNDRGKSWKFVEGSGLANKQLRDAVLPKLPADLKLPEPIAPEVTPK